MILKGNQRGGASNLARHLLKREENEHVTLHELRGFCADDLVQDNTLLCRMTIGK